MARRIEKARDDGNRDGPVLEKYEMYISDKKAMAADVDATLSTAEARERFAELVSRAAFGKERIVLTRRGKPLAAMVPVADLERLQALEDAADRAAVERAETEMARTGDRGVPLAEILAEFGAKR
jgi:prevent-host-death family protein